MLQKLDRITTTYSACWTLWFARISATKIENHTIIGIPRLGKSIVGLVAAATFHSTFASDAGMPDFSLRGFGTVGLVHSDQQQADFVGNFFQPDGAGHTHRWSKDLDTKLGVQLDASFTEKLSGVVQVVSQYRYNGDYVPQVEWANLKYQIHPDVDIRLGRFVASTFLYSQSGMVGYTYPWIRPPQELYATEPFTNKDGVDVTYRRELSNGVNNSVNLSYGRSVKKLPDNGELVVTHCLDVHDTVEIGAATFHLGYTSFNGTMRTTSLDALFNGLVQFGNTVPGPAGQQALQIDHERRAVNSPYSIMTVGAIYDTADWLLMTEWGRATTRNPIFVPDVSAWYATGGYRIGSLMPYLTMAQVRPHRLRIDTIPTTGLSGAAAASAAALNGGITALLNSFAFSQDTVSVGMRWEFRGGMDLKVQYDRLNTGSRSNGRLVNLQPNFHTGDAADIVSVAVDFVF